MPDEGVQVVSVLWSGESFSHHGDHYAFENVQFLPPPLQHPRIPVCGVGDDTQRAHAGSSRPLGRRHPWRNVSGPWNERATGRGGRRSGCREDAPDDIVVAAPVETDPAVYDGAGATRVLITGLLDDFPRCTSTSPQ
ncbi:MAG TPA: hypothetical protein VFX41_04740 [Actinomycetales bacterium]|nr:hypothetical protein [Actinomycetales bacterium]